MSINEQNADSFGTVLEEIFGEVSAHTTDDAYGSPHDNEGTEVLSIETDSEGGYKKTSWRDFYKKKCDVRIKICSPPGTTKYSAEFIIGKYSQCSFDDLEAGRQIGPFTINQERKYGKAQWAFSLTTSPALPPKTPVKIEFQWVCSTCR